MEDWHNINTHLLRQSIGLSIAQAARLVGSCSTEEWVRYETLNITPPRHITETLICINNLRLRLEKTYQERIEELSIKEVPFYTNLSEFDLAHPNDCNLCFFLYKTVIKNIYLNSLPEPSIKLVKALPSNLMLNFDELMQVANCIKSHDDSLH